jgi:phosphoribosylanthranilate isomerase
MRLKICGLKYKDNIEQVAALRPDYMGFIFYPQSKRFVGDDFVMPEISSDIKKVGVFVNADFDYVFHTVIKYKLDLVQLHGDEDAYYCEDIAINFSQNESTINVKIIKAFGVDDNFHFDSLVPYKNFCDYFLFDTKTKDYGGSGHQFDWNVLKKYNNSKPFFLSGGIGLEEIKNIPKLKLQIHAIDVNSKFEIEPGLKNIETIKELVDVLMC